MVEIRKGSVDKNEATTRLVDFFQANSHLNGILYLGYPILYTAGESLTMDALWISKEYGVIGFDLYDGHSNESRSEIQDALYGKIKSFLIQYPQLNQRRDFCVYIEVITFNSSVNIRNIEEKTVHNPADLNKIITELPAWPHPNLFETVLSIVQTIINLRNKNARLYVKKENSRGAKLLKLENRISTLDKEQEKAIIESFEGIQRIRGLAGSGKTIILSLKAAYLHATKKDWRIGVTFGTRALKNQFTDLIERFVVEKKGELPDWGNIRIVQAWGSPSSDGIYYEYCRATGVVYRDVDSATTLRAKTGNYKKSIFEVACEQALIDSKNKPVELYDAILVDEAQDLSAPFLKIAYLMLKKPRRLVYAYDELQKLNEGSSLPAPKVIFGEEEAQDTMLQTCYRNSRPLLATAHALGFGIHRPESLVQFFDQPELWKDVGYEVSNGALVAGSEVTLKRTSTSSPAFLEEHSPLVDLISFKKFSNIEEQAQTIAKEIEKNIKEDELLHKDIVVINPNPLTTKSAAFSLRNQLDAIGIRSHIAGLVNADRFYEEGSIAITGINRAKGNEAAMVYIMNADYCFGDVDGIERELIKKRNILFTAITRSKAWVRIYGVGTGMDSLINEFNITKDRDKFSLHFTYPTHEMIQRLNIIHRDISDLEKNKLKKDITSFKQFSKIVEAIKSGEAEIEDYPEEMREFILKMLD